MSVSMVEIRIKFFKPKLMAAIKKTGTYKDIAPLAWQEMLGWLDNLSPEDMPDEGFGLNYDDPRAQKTGQLRYAAAVQVPKSWEPNNKSSAEMLLFEGGVYAVKGYVGSYQNLGPSISKFRDEWVPNRGLVLDQDRPVLTRFKSDPRRVCDNEQRADICLPVFADRRSEERPLASSSA